jgi:hypothetical protein
MLLPFRWLLYSAGEDTGTCACTGSAGTCVATGAIPVAQPVPTGAVVSKKTLEKFRKHYAAVKGVAKLKPKRKARTKAQGRQLILASAEHVEEPSQQTAFAVFIPLPVFTATAELRSPALTTSSRGAIRISGQSETGHPSPGIDDDDIAILMLLAA